MSEGLETMNQHGLAIVRALLSVLSWGGEEHSGLCPPTTLPSCAAFPGHAEPPDSLALSSSCLAHDAGRASAGPALRLGVKML